MVSQHQQVLADFYDKHRDVIFKPLDGMGGKGIFRITGDGANLYVVLETLTHNFQTQIVAQRYLPEIAEGDKRILLIDGEPVPYALARIPKSGETRGNLAAGGTGQGQPLSDRDLEIATAVGPELQKRGLYLTGIDVIGNYLTEINVTCPTCIRELDEQFNIDIGTELLEALTSKLAKSG